MAASSNSDDVWEGLGFANDAALYGRLPKSLVNAVREELTRKLLAKHREVVETEKGYEFQYAPEDVSVAEVAAWGKHWKVALTCNEFGVFRGTANPADRAMWLRDVRSALEKYGIGWTMWDYAGGFSVVNRKDGVTNPDEVTLKALGLKVPPSSPGPANPGPANRGPANP